MAASFTLRLQSEPGAIGKKQGEKIEMAINHRHDCKNLVPATYALGPATV